MLYIMQDIYNEFIACDPLAHGSEGKVAVVCDERVIYLAREAQFRRDRGIMCGEDDCEFKDCALIRAYPVNTPQLERDGFYPCG
jgi:hypothetical protein